MIQEKALVMNFDYTETQHMVAAAARDFAEQYIRKFFQWMFLGKQVSWVLWVSWFLSNTVVLV